MAAHLPIRHPVRNLAHVVTNAEGYPRVDVRIEGEEAVGVPDRQHHLTGDVVEGFDALKKATAPFTPDLAAQRADVSAEDIVKAARMYGSWKKGSISVGTGPNMSGGGNITEYLNLSLTSIGLLVTWLLTSWFAFSVGGFSISARASAHRLASPDTARARVSAMCSQVHASSDWYLENARIDLQFRSAELLLVRFDPHCSVVGKSATEVDFQADPNGQ